MKRRSHLSRLLATALLILSINAPLAADEPSETVLIAFDKYPQASITVQDATIESVQLNGQPAVRMTTGHANDWPGVTLPAIENSWDMKLYREITLPVKNTGTKTVTVNCRVDSVTDGQTNSLTRHVELKPGETKTLTVPLQRPHSPAAGRKTLWHAGLSRRLCSGRWTRRFEAFPIHYFHQ